MDGNKETLQPYQNPHRNDEIDGIQKDTTFVEQTQKKTGLLTNLENTAYKLRHGRPLSPDITITTGEPKSPNNMETKTDHTSGTFRSPLPTSWVQTYTERNHIRNH